MDRVNEKSNDDDKCFLCKCQEVLNKLHKEVIDYPEEEFGKLGFNCKERYKDVDGDTLSEFYQKHYGDDETISSFLMSNQCECKDIG